MKEYISILLALFISVNCFANKEKWDADKKDWSELMLCTYKGQHKRMKKILTKPVDVNYYSKKGLTALIIAIRKQDTMAMNILFRSDKIFKDSSENLIMLACGYKSAEVIKILFDQKYPIIDYPNGYSPLMAACSFSSKEVVALLLDKGLKINQQRNVDGMTPLMFAAYNGKVDILKVLLSRGADRNIEDKNGKKAIVYANEIPDWLQVKEIDKLEIKYLLGK